MGKTQRKTRRSFRLLGVFLMAFLSVGLAVACAYFYKEYNNINADIASLDTQISSLNETVDSKDSEVSSLNSTLSDLNNIEESISRVKEEFFTLALEAHNKAESGEADFKVCYLTFDDGPYRKTTPTFLDILDKHDAQATFFLLEKEGDDDIYLREKISGHTIGNHTASHKIKAIYSSVDSFIADVKENREFIQNLLGITTDVMRFPGGSPQAAYMGLDKSAIVSELVDMHYGYVDWNLTTGDGGGYVDVDESLHNVIDYSSNFNTLVILMHDYSVNTSLCLDDMLTELENQGFIFLPLWYDSPAVKKQ